MAEPILDESIPIHRLVVHLLHLASNHEQMLEDFDLARVARDIAGEPRRPFCEVVEQMRQAGEIDV